MAVQNPQALQELMQALSGGGGGMVAPPAPVQFQQASSPSQDIDRQRQEFIDILTSQEPTPLDVPDAPGKFQMVAAGISDAISKLAAGRAPRGLPISDNRGLLRQRRSEREAIIRKNTETQNEFQQRQARAKAEIGLRELDRKQGRLDRGEDLEARIAREDELAKKASDERREIALDNQKFREKMTRLEFELRSQVPDKSLLNEQREAYKQAQLAILDIKGNIQAELQTKTPGQIREEADELFDVLGLDGKSREMAELYFERKIGIALTRREIELGDETMAGLDAKDNPPLGSAAQLGGALNKNLVDLIRSTAEPPAAEDLGTPGRPKVFTGSRGF